MGRSSVATLCGQKVECHLISGYLHLQTAKVLPQYLRRKSSLSSKQGVTLEKYPAGQLSSSLNKQRTVRILVKSLRIIWLKIKLVWQKRKKKSPVKESSQDGVVLRLWAHLLSWACQRSQLSAEDASIQKTGAYQEGSSITKRHKEGTTIRQVGGAEAVQPGPTPSGEWPTNGRNITIIEILPKEQGIWFPNQSPQPGDPTLARWAHRTSNIENYQDLGWKSWKAIGNRLCS